MFNNGKYSILEHNSIKIHNYIITTSVMIRRDIINIDGSDILFDEGTGVTAGSEDYRYWLSITNNRSILYINEPLVYYDMSHGGGQRWR